VISRRQLVELGIGEEAVRHRLATARLHRIHAGIYAVGRRELSRLGELMAAVLACGEGATLSDGSAAELWCVRPWAGLIEVTVPARRNPRVPGIRTHRRDLPASDTTLYRAIPVTKPACTLVDIAYDLSVAQVERAVNEADRLDLIDPEALRQATEHMPGRRGAPKLRRILDRHTFTLTRSELERLFKPIARAAGLPAPKVNEEVNGYEVDFYWPALGLVVETDGFRHHRTAAQQTRALERDQTHYAADLTPLRFSHAQVAYRRDYVRGALASARKRIERERGGGN